jgi:hypothetical protein
MLPSERGGEGRRGREGRKERERVRINQLIFYVF